MILVVAEGRLLEVHTDYLYIGGRHISKYGRHISEYGRQIRILMRYYVRDSCVQDLWDSCVQALEKYLVVDSPNNISGS